MCLSHVKKEKYTRPIWETRASIRDHHHLNVPGHTMWTSVEIHRERSMKTAIDIIDEEIIIICQLLFTISQLLTTRGN